MIGRFPRTNTSDPIAGLPEHPPAMPLSPAAERRPVHTRTIECRGYRRADGLWDIEGHLADVKSYAFLNACRGAIEPGDPLHAMALRLTVDDTLVIRDAEASSDKVPYQLCPAITPAFKKLVGLTIGSGFRRQVMSRLGGIEGCTHLVELVWPVATTAFQTIYPILARETGELPAGDGTAARGRPAILNTCHVYATDSEVVRRYWPDYYRGDGSEPEGDERERIPSPAGPDTRPVRAAAG